jgi:hypothetical protein
VQRHELARRQRDRAVLIRQPDHLSLERGYIRDLGLGNQAVDRVVELSHDRHGVGTRERGPDQERRGYVSDVDAVVMERRDLVVGAAWDRLKRLHLESFTRKEALAGGDRNRQ